MIDVGARRWSTALGNGVGARHWGTALGHGIGERRWGTALGYGVGARHDEFVPYIQDFYLFTTILRAMC